MDKKTKLRKLVGAVVAFRVDTPESASGEKTQTVVLRIDNVRMAKSNLDYYVCGVALKRIEDPQKSEFRQYAIKRIHNSTIAIVVDNAWSKTMPSLRRNKLDAVSTQ